MSKKMFFIFHGRFPSEKAASLFSAKSCEAFADQGIDVILLAPRRLSRKKVDISSFYKIKNNFKVVFLPTLDLFNIPLVRILAFHINFIFFSLSCLIYLLFKAKKEDIIYSNESLPILFASSFFTNTLYEMHDFPEKKICFYKLLLKRSKWVLITNSWKVKKAKEIFGLKDEKIICETNAVEMKDFDMDVSKEEARKRFGLPQDKFIVVYTGHLFGWKGVDTLALASRNLPNNFLVIFAGGNDVDVKKFKDKYSNIKNIRIIGFVNRTDMPYWQKVADVLVLPNTTKEDISKYYTSPMKLFEYMASKRLIISSDLPSVREILNDKNAILIEADNPKRLSDAIQEVRNNKVEFYNGKVEQAYKDVLSHTWQERAKRIICFMNLS